MALFLFLLQIPLITILLQGFLCNEDPNLNYTLPEISCSGATHQVFIVFSVLTLVLYVGFLVI